MNEVDPKVKSVTDAVQPPAIPVPSFVQGTDYPPADLRSSLRMMRAEAEVYAISRALEYTGWNRKRAAQLLRISYRGLLYKIRQHNITPATEPALVPFGQRLKVE
jgi:DNA-binding NtrC family response regulator